MLFNSTDSPYARYDATHDNLAGDGGEGDEREREEEAKALAQQPQSLIDGDLLPAFKGLDYDYKPSLKEQPRWDQNVPTVGVFRGEWRKGEGKTREEGRAKR